MSEFRNNMLEKLNLTLPEKIDLPILSTIDRILIALAGPLFRYDARKNAANKRTVQLLEDGNLVDTGHGYRPKLDEINNSDDFLYLSDKEYRDANLKEIIKKTIYIFFSNSEFRKKLLSDTINDNSINQDWFARWRREAEIISEPDMQNIWSRILAEETVAPNSISYRTLDVIKNLLPDEARLFLELLKYTTKNFIIPYTLFNKLDETERDQNLIQFSDLQKLADAGLIFSLTMVGDQDYYNQYKTEINGYIIELEVLNKNNKVQLAQVLSGVELSRSGRELSRIADIPALSENEVEKLFHYLIAATADMFRNIKIRLKDSSGNIKYKYET